ncbi:MAG: alpha/beta hydrolase [Flavobacteriaceae bacterium]|nr:alpha/beta hydrolase [Flavobacteriaceae bacterium]
MTGNFVDNIRFLFKSPLKDNLENTIFLDTDYGKIRCFDTGGNKPVIINVPDGPNVIEHQNHLIKELSNEYRVVCFEYPGIGLSYPNFKFDYSFKAGANLLIQIMDTLKVPEAILLFSCSNGFYATKAASDYPERIKQVFLSQTPSVKAMQKWTEKSIPKVLKVPVIGQISNAIMAKKISSIWYKYALPKESPLRDKYSKIAQKSLSNGGCFCLSSLVQGLKKDRNTLLTNIEVPTTMVWGAKDFTHRNTDKNSIKDHIHNCKIVEFKNSGHFPELENTKKFVGLIKSTL